MVNFFIYSTIYPQAIFTLACPIVQQQLPHTIAQIAVNDSDSGINAEVFYHLSPVSSPSFGSSLCSWKNSHSGPAQRLDEKTGSLFVGPNGLDRERQSFYKFVVAVSDGAATVDRPALFPQERHVVQTVVHITVEDENDNAPRIIYPESQTVSAFQTTDPSLQPPGKIPAYHLDRYNSPSGLPSGYEHPADVSDGTNLRWAKLNSPVSPPVSSDLRNAGDTTLLSSLSSPDVFWAAIICLIIATGVLIFLIVLITTVTCHRRMKPAGPSSLNSETRQNEWAQSDEGIHDSRYGSCPLDNVEMNISKNSPGISVRSRQKYDLFGQKTVVRAFVSKECENLVMTSYSLAY
ncbi:hypothetical protein FGIG_00414 [Fasciola gigantica]|uniref:Cadherin domain-containing protein n=1 Tax=Fasciola gigantica TaxID=46835 RepID=A0A504Y821_FASGI|nr:hypothetical protein FGIG_00414 [Fasciola gigantica]